MHQIVLLITMLNMFSHLSVGRCFFYLCHQNDIHHTETWLCTSNSAQFISVFSLYHNAMQTFKKQTCQHDYNSIILKEMETESSLWGKRVTSSLSPKRNNEFWPMFVSPVNNMRLTRLKHVSLPNPSGLWKNKGEREETVMLWSNFLKKPQID